MSITLTLSFILSAALMAALFVFRAFEERNSVIYARELRGKLDYLVLRSVVSLKKLTHTTWRGTLRKVFAYGTHAVVYGALVVVRMLERKLHQVALFIRGRYTPTEHDSGRGSASQYLKKVGRSAKEHTGER